MAFPHKQHVASSRKAAFRLSSGSSAEELERMRLFKFIAMAYTPGPAERKVPIFCFAKISYVRQCFVLSKRMRIRRYLQDSVRHVYTFKRAYTDMKHSENSHGIWNHFVLPSLFRACSSSL